MTREDLETYIHNQFEDTTTNTPWTQFPHYKVYRHQSNHKWFALVMNITTDKLGWSSIRPIDVLNIKCEPFMIALMAKDLVMGKLRPRCIGCSVLKLIMNICF